MDMVERMPGNKNVRMALVLRVYLIDTMLDILGQFPHRQSQFRVLGFGFTMDC